MIVTLFFPIGFGRIYFPIVAFILLIRADGGGRIQTPGYPRAKVRCFDYSRDLMTKVYLVIPFCHGEKCTASVRWWSASAIHTYIIYQIYDEL